MANTTKTWGQLGREVVEQLQQLEAKYQERSVPLEELNQLAKPVLKEVESRNFDTTEKQKAFSRINREINAKYPRLAEEKINYFHDASGRGDVLKYRHNIFIFLNNKPEEERIKIINQLKSDAELTSTTPETEEQIESRNEPNSETITPQTNLEDMTLESLNLDPNTLEAVENAMQHYGLSLPEIMRKALTYYAKSLSGKAKKHDEDLSTVPTNELLTAPKYSNHPERGRELSKRTVRAIKLYNSQQSDPKDRWAITTSLVAELTGSREAIVKPVIEELATDINDHHAKYGMLKEDGSLNIYINRKRWVKSVKDAINLTELIADGLE